MANGDGWEKEARAGIKRREDFLNGTSPLRGEHRIAGRVVLDWGWLKIKKNWHWRYSSEETHVTVKLPWPRCVFFDAAYDMLVTARPAFFIAFGKIEIAHTAWHARGQIIPVDIVEESPPPKTIGYQNPINLANYK